MAQHFLAPADHRPPDYWLLSYVSLSPGISFIVVEAMFTDQRRIAILLPAGSAPPEWVGVCTNLLPKYALRAGGGGARRRGRPAQLVVLRAFHLARNRRAQADDFGGL